MRLSPDEVKRLKRAEDALRPLGALILRPSRRQYFMENIDAGEPEIALHTLCEYLLEPDTPPLSGDQVDQIEAAHQMMEIKEDCVHRLRAKAGL